MATTLVSAEQVLPYVHDELPAVPQLVAVRAIVDAARVFCHRSTFWREWLVDISVTPSTAEYTMVLPSSTELVGVHSAFLDTREVAVTNEANTVRFRGYSAGQVRAVTPMRGTSVKLTPAPDKAQAMALWVSLKPAAGGTEVPEFLFQQYASDIGHGAKDILCRQANTPWHSPDIAAGHRAQFNYAWAQARQQLNTGFMGEESQVEFRKWV